MTLAQHATPFTGLGARAGRIPGLVAPPSGGSKAARMRHALRSNGPLDGAALAKLTDVDHKALVRALLKHDINRGRILYRNGIYEWNETFDAQRGKELAHAQRLLEQHGYDVRVGVHQPEEAQR